MQTEEQKPNKFARWNRIVSGQETVEIGRSPKEIVYERDILKVYKFKRDTPATQKHPILVVYSLINRPAVLDLLPGRSVVERMLEAGFEVYLIDWGVPTPLDYHSGIDTYVNLYIRSAIKETLKHSGQKELHLFGYCMGGSLAAISTAVRPKGIKSLTLLGTPLAFRSEQLLYKWSNNAELNKPENLVEVWRVAPAWNFESFTLLTLDKKPVMLKTLYERLDDEAFVESFMAMERWVGDNIPMAATIFTEFVRGCFLNDDLIEGRLEVGGKRVNLSSVQVPVLNIIGEADHLVPPETTGIEHKPFPNGEYIRFKSGHVGLSVSSKSHKLLWPQVCDWLSQQDS